MARPARYVPEDVIRESDNLGGGKENETFEMLSYYVGYEMARVTEQKYSHYSAGKGRHERQRF